MNGSRPPIWLTASIALMTVVALAVVAQRYQVEAKNKSVSISAEYETVEALATADNKSVPAALQELKVSGMRSIVIGEDVVGDLIGQGRIQILPLRQVLANAPSQIQYEVQGAPEDLLRLEQGAKVRYGPGHTALGANPSDIVVYGIPKGLLRTMPVGLNPVACQATLKAGLQIVARMSNSLGETPDSVKATVDWAHSLGASIFLPEGDQVLGRRDGMTALADALRTDGMLYSSPEFAKLGGDTEFLNKAPDLVIRLHSAQAAELDKLPFGEAVDRYARAARERNMRLLLLRSANYAAGDPFGEFSKYVEAVAKVIQAQGSVLGAPHPFQEPSTPRPLFLLLGLTLAPIGAWVVGKFWPKATVPAAVGFTLFGLACWSPGLRHYCSLLAALTLPIAGFLVIDLDPKPKPSGYDYLRIVGFSLLGGLFVAGMLSGLKYYIVAQEFQGVKLAVFFPVFVIGGYYFARYAGWKQNSSKPLTYFSAIIAMIVLGALAVMYARTGNDNPAVVSPLELKIRDILDHVLFVRPRTKSFLIGLPALWLGTWLLARAKREKWAPSAQGGWMAFVLMGGAIASTDIVDTLCHIHTQVILSLERIGVEVIIGAIFGVILVAIVRALGLFKSSPSEATP